MKPHCYYCRSQTTHESCNGCIAWSNFRNGIPKLRKHGIPKLRKHKIADNSVTPVDEDVEE